MSALTLKGPPRHVAGGLGMLAAATADVLWRRCRGRPLCAAWPIGFEIGTLFYRRQFVRALAFPDIHEGRAYFDAVTATVRRRWPVRVEAAASVAGAPAGLWFHPEQQPVDDSGSVVLYLHGGGYAFYAEVSRRFAGLLAHWLRRPLFAPDYRLTPEHPYPAQLDDALAAYRSLLERGIAPERIVVLGDSAGGHLALMLAVKLRELALPQPSLVIGLSPWTDTGGRGASLFGNDVYDMVQGVQTATYSRWLKAGTSLTDRQISPIHQDFRGVAPIYLQAGGKEILVDMVRDFAEELRRQDVRVHLDVWTHMTHEFHAYADTLPESRDALDRIAAAIHWAQGMNPGDFPSIDATELAHLDRRQRQRQRSLAAPGAQATPRPGPTSEDRHRHPSAAP